MKRFDVVNNLIKDIKNPIGAEIGVCDGVFSDYLLSHNPSLILYAIDPFTMYERNYESGISQHNKLVQADFDIQCELTKNKLSKFGDRSIFIRETATKASEYIENNYLDFVFIDANHLYKYVKQDILTYYEKVKMDGIIAGHDYNPNNKNHLINTCRAVNETFDYLNFRADTTWWAIKGARW